MDLVMRVLSEQDGVWWRSQRKEACYAILGSLDRVQVETPHRTRNRKGAKKGDTDTVKMKNLTVDASFCLVFGPTAF